jgi:P4 family phage/plasmid primase-like protien
MTTLDELSKKIIRPPSLTKSEIEDLYSSLGFVVQTCDLVWNSETGKKAMKGAYADKERFDRNDNCWYILTNRSKLIVIDLDTDNEQNRRAFELAAPSCRMVVKTKKGYHFYFIDNGELDHKINSDIHLDIIGGGNGGRHPIICPPSFYNDGVKTHHYNLLSYPDKPDRKTKTQYNDLSPLPPELVDYLYSLGFKKPGNAVVELPPIRTQTDVPKSLMELKQLCDCLTPEWLKDFENWKKFAYAMKSAGDDDDTLNLFLMTSARAAGYDSAGAEHSNRQFWRAARPNGRISVGSLKHWAKLCNPQRYFENARGDYLRLLTGNPLGVNSNSLCELFINEMAGDIMYSVSAKDYFIYDPATTLWKGGGGVRAYINNVVVDVCQRAILKVLEGINKSSVDEAIDIRKVLLKVAKMVDGKHAVNLVNDYLPAFCVPAEDPLRYFDNNPALLPLANGVWDFEKGLLVPYHRDHFFTHKIDIVYNPTADSSLIERAMGDWFKKDPVVIEFIQMVIGYCLTGFIDRQEFYVAWGSSAGNGKSLLWGEVLPSLLGKKYYARITSNIFAETNNVNNDELYNLNGKRFAFMSEPKVKMNENEIKAATGDAEITAQAKYKNALTFNMMCKAMMACNDLPDVDVGSTSMYRRFCPVEQNVPCLEADDYDATPAAIREAGLVVKKDAEFVKALLADREGTLRWAIEGAKRYMANPRTPMPESMKSVKSKARDTIDTLTQWLRGNIEAGDRNLTFKDIKDEWRAKGLNFEQNKKGFSAKLTQKLKMLGFTVNEGRMGKSEEKVLKARLVPDDVENMLEG